jgi:hypothetical protein
MIMIIAWKIDDCACDSKISVIREEVHHITPPRALEAI